MKTLLSIEPLETRIAPASLPTLNVPTLNGVTGFEISSPELVDGVSNIGDFNGDGFSDFAIVSTSAASGAGKLFVVYGKATGFPALFDLGSLNGTNGFTITGEANGDAFGDSVEGGDLNGDGLVDLAVASPKANNGGSDRGSVYVIFGRSSTGSSIALSSLNGATGFKIVGDQSGAELGKSLAIGNDINGDGIQDLLAGAPYYDIQGRTSAGIAISVFGRSTGFTASIALTAIDGTNGFIIAGAQSSQRLGMSVGFSGDFNLDGIGDFAVGASTNSGGSFGIDGREGDVGFVYFGHSTPWTAVTLVSDLAADGGFTFTDARGLDLFSTMLFEDVNSDGKSDTTTFGGYELYGGGVAGLFTALGDGKPVTKSPFSNNSRRVVGLGVELVTSGSSVFYNSSTGDFNGDGYTDIVIDQAGDTKAELYFGKKLNSIRIVGKNKTDKGFAVTGLSLNDPNAGSSAQFIGDINGDGFGDMAMQAPKIIGSGERVFIVFGSGLQIARGGKSATWTDVDGDIVTAKTTKGAFDYTQFHFAAKQAGAKGLRLDELDFSSEGSEFAGSNITVTVKRNPVKGQGDGSVSIGKINAAGVDLGVVKVAGNLGEIDAGNASLSDAAIKSLTVASFGRIAGALPDASDIRGAVGTLTVKGAMDVAALNLSGGALAGLGKLAISGNFSGDISVAGALGSFKSRDIADGSSLSAGSSGKGASLSARVIGDGVSIAIAGKIAAIQAASVGTATITGDSLAKLKITGERATGLSGDFSATLSLANSLNTTTTPTLGKTSIAGVVKNATIQVGGSVGAFAAGAMEGSKLFAGFTPSSGLSPLAGGVFGLSATIKSIVVSGKAASSTTSGTAFASSSIVAAIVGKATIASLDETNGGSQFGIGFRDSIGSVSVKEPAFKYDSDQGGTQTSGDFKVAEL